MNLPNRRDVPCGSMVLVCTNLVGVAGSATDSPCVMVGSAEMAWAAASILSGAGISNARTNVEMLQHPLTRWTNSNTGDKVVKLRAECAKRPLLWNNQRTTIVLPTLKNVPLETETIPSDNRSRKWRANTSTTEKHWRLRTRRKPSGQNQRVYPTICWKAVHIDHAPMEQTGCRK